MLKCEQESRGIWHGKATLCWPLTDFQFEEKILARKRNQLLCYNHQTTVIANIPLVSQSISIYIYYGTCERRIYMLLLMLDGWRMATRNWSHVSMWSRVISRDIQLQTNLSFIQKFLDKREIGLKLDVTWYYTWSHAYMWSIAGCHPPSIQHQQ